MAKHWSETLSAVVGHVRRILLCGEPGTGKTSYAFKLAHDSKRPVERVTLCAGMFSDALLGKYLLREGSTVWVDGPAVRAMRQGGVLLLDEIADAGPEIQSTLRAILDDENVCTITLDNGDTVKPKQGFSIIATMNGEVQSLLPALLDRFDVVLAHCDTPNPGIADAISNAGVAAYIRNSAGNAEDRANEWRPAITTRRLIAFSRLATAIEMVDAAEIVFGPSQAETILTALVDAERNTGKGAGKKTR